MRAQNKDTPTMTKEDLLAYKERYRAVNALEIEHLRSMTLEQKFEQAAALMESVDSMGWAEALAADDDQAREWWIRLKEAYSRA
jgi:hypothetical protein